jgi:hypothetical protein
VGLVIGPDPEATVVTILSLLLGCTEEGDAPKTPEGTPFDSCDPKEIESLAQKHGYMLAFEACGSNLFQDFAWSTDGHRLYFQLGMTHHVMDAASKTKATKVVPTPTPIGSVTWVTPTRLVMPIGPAEGKEDAPPRLAIFDTDTGAVFNIELLGFTEPTDLYRGPDPNRVLLTAKRDGVRRVLEVELSTSTVHEPFPWANDVETFSYTHAGGGVVIGSNNTVTLHDATTGKARGQWSPATRGVLHPKGRWLVLEHLGEPVSVFHPTGIEELPAAEREEALRRAEQKAAELPPEAPRTIRPPTLSFVDTHTARRWLLTAIQGNQFEWYETTDYYGSFVSWGFEQKQLRRNVLLGDNTAWLAAAEQGRHILGLKPASSEAPAPAEPAPTDTPPAPAPAAP